MRAAGLTRGARARARARRRAPVLAPAGRLPGGAGGPLHQDAQVHVHRVRALLREGARHPDGGAPPRARAARPLPGLHAAARTLTQGRLGVHPDALAAAAAGRGGPPHLAQLHAASTCFFMFKRQAATLVLRSIICILRGLLPHRVRDPWTVSDALGPTGHLRGGGGPGRHGDRVRASARAGRAARAQALHPPNKGATGAGPAAGALP